MDGKLMRTIILLLVSFTAHGQIFTTTMGGELKGNAAPTDSPGQGTYSSAQTITLTDATADLIRYTLDGSTPSFTAGTLYTGTFSSGSSTVTIKAIGCDFSGACGGVLSSVYTISAPAYTLGDNTTLGDDTGSSLQGYTYCGPWTTNSSGGVATSITAAVYNATGGTYLRMAIYTDASNPANLVSGSDTGNITITRATAPTDVSQWTTGTISSSLAPNTKYWLCMEVNDGGAHLFKGNITGNGAYGGLAYGAFPSTFPAGGHKDPTWAMFASY
jgi:hypothetical protein